MSKERTNAQWLRQLSEEPDPQALDALTDRLLRGLRYAVKDRYGVTEADLEDFVQEAMVKILDNDDGDDAASPIGWLPSDTPSPERRVTQGSLRALLAHLIKEELTDLQREAMVAVVFHGMPLEEVAHRLGSNRNALYKLLHDARKRLRHRLEARGLTVEEVMAAFAPE